MDAWFRFFRKEKRIVVPSSVTSINVGDNLPRGIENNFRVDAPAAVMVSVELADFAPGVIEDEENKHAGAGAGPAIAQLS